MKTQLTMTMSTSLVKSYSWSEVFKSINILSTELSKFVTKGDRCLLISENRPEWFISDMSIMLSQSITVPASDGHLKNTIQQAMTKKFTDLNEETVKTINFPVQLFGPSISKSKHEGKDRQHSFNKKTSNVI